MKGRPLGFILIVVGGWIAVRAVALWPVADPVGVPVLAARGAKPAMDTIPSFLPAVAPWPPPIAPDQRQTPHRIPRRTPVGLRDAQILALVGVHGFGLHYPAMATDAVSVGGSAPPRLVSDAPFAVPAVAAAASRWSLSSWLIARGGATGRGALPLLGASQAGARLSYALDRRGRIAAFARVASPLGNRQREAAVGAQWRPGPLPVVAFAEARQRRGIGLAPALGAFGGGSVALPAELRLDGFGQAGWVGGGAPTGFADAQVQLARPVATLGPARLELALGAWGAVQRGAQRLDIGPGVGLMMPMGTGSLRLGVDWRMRIAGDAAPGAGPAVTLAAGF